MFLCYQFLRDEMLLPLRISSVRLYLASKIHLWHFIPAPLYDLGLGGGFLHFKEIKKYYCNCTVLANVMIFLSFSPLCILLIQLFYFSLNRANGWHNNEWKTDTFPACGLQRIECWKKRTSKGLWSDPVRITPVTICISQLGLKDLCWQR